MTQDQTIKRALKILETRMRRTSARLPERRARLPPVAAA